MSTAEGQKQKTNSGDRYVFVCQNHSFLGHNSQEVLNTFIAETENLVGVYIEPSVFLGQCSTALQSELPRIKFGITGSSLIMFHQ